MTGLPHTDALRMTQDVVRFVKMQPVQDRRQFVVVGTAAPLRRRVSWIRRRNSKETTAVVQHETRPGLADSTADLSLSSRTDTGEPMVPAKKAGDGPTSRRQSLRRTASAGRRA